MPEKARALRDDTRLPHVRMALSRQRALDLFNERILPEVLPGRVAIDLSQRRIRYKPGKECRVHYRVKIAPEGEGRPLYQVVTITFRRDGEGLAEVAASGTATNGALAGKTVFLAEYTCLVEFYPSDHRLPVLARAVDPRAVGEQLSSGADELATALVTRVRVLRYRPGSSCVVRYTLEPQGGGEAFEIVGKVYPTSAGADEMRRKLASLSEQAAREGLVIPQPLDVPQADHLVLMDKVPGANLDKLLLATASEGEAAPLVDLAARSLAVFHSLRFDEAGERSAARYFRRLHQRLDRLQRVVPELEGAARAVFERIDFDGLAAEREGETLVHSDFKPNQLLIDGDSAALVDLDRTGLGDPAVDVGNFMAVLRKKAIVNAREHFAPLEERFLERYLEHRGAVIAPERARAFEAIALVRMVLAKFERSPRSYARKGSSWPWLAVLDEAERCLAGA